MRFVPLALSTSYKPHNGGRPQGGSPEKRVRPDGSIRPFSQRQTGVSALPALPSRTSLPNIRHMLTHQDPEYLCTRLQVLIVEHRDLDEAITRLTESQNHDAMLLQRLKKRKLQLKDRIALLERLLEPDVPA